MCDFRSGDFVGGTLGGGLRRNALAGGGPGGGPGGGGPSTLGSAVRGGGSGEPKVPYSGSGSATVSESIFRTVLTSPGVAIAARSTLDVERKLASDSLTSRAGGAGSSGST